MSFGDHLRKLRDARDFSLRELAEKVGVSAAFLSDVELGRRFPSDEKIEALAHALSVDPAELRKYDFRSQAEEIRKMMVENAGAGIAFRTVAEELKRGHITPEELVKRIKRK